MALGAWWLAARIDAAGAAGRSYQRLQAIDSWFTPPGELIYSQIRDNGCGTDTSSWLGNNKVCGHTLIKIYKGSGSSEASLRAAHKLIIDHGWGGQVSMEALTRDVEYLVTHRESMETGYLYPGLTQPRINLNFFARDDGRYVNETPRQFYGIDQDIALSGDEFLYGISVTSTYGR